MKGFTLIIFLFVLAFGARAATQYHDFMDTQGRTIRGRVLGFETHSGTVTIERDNKRTAKVPINIFSAEGQQYIRAWEFSKIFLSESSFKISAKRKEVKDEEESYSDMIHAKKVENLGYEITLENRSASKIKDLEIEYCIYYEQERASRSKQLCEQGVRCGNLLVEYILPKSNKELRTEAVKVYKAELDADWIYTSGTKNVQRGRVHGIWLRVHMTLPSGEKLTRDYCLPDSLNNSKAWMASTVAVGMNSSSKRKGKKR